MNKVRVLLLKINFYPIIFEFKGPLPWSLLPVSMVTPALKGSFPGVEGNKRKESQVLFKKGTLKVNGKTLNPTLCLHNNNTSLPHSKNLKL